MMDLFGVLVYECDKLCDVGEYFNYKNCNCRKKLIEEWLKNVVKVLMEMK